MPNKDGCIAQRVVVHESNTGKDASLWFEHSVQLHSQAYAGLQVSNSTGSAGQIDVFEK